MSFEEYEVSVQSSRPIELYDFSYQGGHLRYTSADRNIEFEGNTWLAAPLERSKIEDTGEIAKAAMTIDGPDVFEVAELFSVAPPDDVVGFALRRLQFDDPSGQAPAIWLGRVLTASWPPNRSQLRCESLLSSLKQVGLRRVYGKNCPHILYGSRCKVSMVAFEVNATVTSQIGRSIVSSAFDAAVDGYFAGGMLVWQKSPGYYVRRGIKSHVGDTVQITHPMPGLTGGVVIQAYPGCDHTFDGAGGCGPRYDNQDNYGGFPFSKQKNPFGQASVF